MAGRPAQALRRVPSWARMLGVAAASRARTLGVATASWVRMFGVAAATWAPLAGAIIALGVAAAARAQVAPPPAPSETALLAELAAAIESLSDYRVAGVPLPRVRQLPQREIEARFCDGPCSALAAYLPGDGIYLSAHLEPLREAEDRAALLHELVHHFQQGHPKYAALASCQREREKEREAVAIQNAYLARLGARQRVRFNDTFDCSSEAKDGGSP